MRILLSVILLATPSTAWALEERAHVLRATHEPLAIACLVLFVLAYILVTLEELTHIRKSKPAVLVAALIWVLIAIIAQRYGVSHEDLKKAILHDLDEYGSLFLFLLVAMTFVNAMTERGVFEALRSRLVHARFSYRTLFWVTGIVAFFLSAVADNLTTALVMGAVIMAVGAEDDRFVKLSMINVVVAANAGGAFSPFGDITTLMVWQSEIVDFFQFFSLFLPAIINFLVPAAIMSPFLPVGTPTLGDGIVPIRRGGKRTCMLFAATIAMAVVFQQVFGLPPFVGMIGGFGLLSFLHYFLRTSGPVEQRLDIDFFARVARAEWDTLLFFLGVIFSVGGLAYLGFLEFASNGMYAYLGPTVSNVSAGIVSAVVDNIPVMFAVLSMNPEMDTFQWLLVTMTTGIGGSLLSVGSAAGVALMGVSKGKYTFFSHLRWFPVVAVGYVAAIAVHFLVN